jgi:nucleotidyltransferase/DNA polymerase involved in DNA repair
MRECPAWWLAAARKTFYLCSRTLRFVKAPGRPQKSPERDGRRPPAEDHPRRHGRLLRIRRAADNPELRGKPVAVGSSRERGVVAAASYEARKFGVRSAMPSVTAKRQCPDLIFVKPRFEVYKAVSQQIREIFAEHTAIIEPLSLDEAYLDVTENLQGISLARDVALAIRSKIKEVTGLNASAGISYNKFLAKLCHPLDRCDLAFAPRGVRIGTSA